MATDGTNRISVWQWGDAPDEYEKLSRHGGDEDYVLHVPAGASKLLWPFGLDVLITGSEDSYILHWGHVDRHELPNGDIVVIFAHA